ncbi:hypothetical protein [Bradyrhizobium prioriisuperbiae]|uniref:hypothetical protein n=1 Tax=Bradyrhizobium prioriisuperbiae TaxID=2854389 RepID=UPI0028EF6C29|nr:hypothetical protein [Bradyrhizobium prioritasuperba]
MIDTSPPSFRAIWRDTIDAMTRLRWLSLIGLLIILSAEAIKVLALSDRLSLQEPVNLVCSILLLPLDVAIYRLLILGEAASRYRLDPFDHRFQRLLIWTICWWGVIVLPPYVVSLITSADQWSIVAFVGTLLLCIPLLRMIVLFPAIAVDASGASLDNAIADTRGQLWLILKAFFLVWLLPVLAMCLVLLGTLLLGVLISDTSTTSPDWSVSSSDWPAALQIIFFGGLYFLTQVATAAMVSRLFGWIGSKVKGRDFQTALPQGT